MTANPAPEGGCLSIPLKGVSSPQRPPLGGGSAAGGSLLQFTLNRSPVRLGGTSKTRRVNPQDLGKQQEIMGYLATVPEAQTGDNWTLRMVGTGNACATGGQTVPLVCPNCHHEVKVVAATCGRIECPTCWSTWARRGATRIAARVWGYMEATRSKLKPRHITFDVEDLDFGKAKQKALDFGFTGGALVLHPWRIKPEYHNLISKICAQTHEKNRYEIARQLMNKPEGEGRIEVLEYSPHAHLIGYGRGISIERGSTEYKFKVIRTCESLEGAESAFFYLLSHSYVPEPHKVVYRYFGVCSPQKLKPTWTGKRHDYVRCPVCNEPVIDPETGARRQTSKYWATGWGIVQPKVRVEQSGSAPPGTG